MEAIATSAWFIPVLAAVMLLGLFSLLTYVVPGLTIIWVAVLVYGIVYGFNTWGIVLFAIITLLMLGGNLVDNYMMGKEAHKTGAKWWSIVLALIAGVIASFFITPFGGLAVAAVVILIIEWIRRKDFKEGLKSTGGILKGCGVSVVIRFFIGMVMIGLWAVWAFLVN
jgi:uncharacterized protein YqgC (DUF456 family)